MIVFWALTQKFCCGEEVVVQYRNGENQSFPFVAIDEALMEQMRHCHWWLTKSTMWLGHAVDQMKAVPFVDYPDLLPMKTSSLTRRQMPDEDVVNAAA